MGPAVVTDDLDWKSGWWPSNSDEGESFQAKWCNGCEADHGYHNGSDVGPGCVIFVRGLSGEYPDEWQTAKSEVAVSVRCTAFTECGPCAEQKAAHLEKVWPTKTEGGWCAQPVEHVIGQEPMFD